MRKIWLITCMVINFSFVFNTQAYAHLTGQPPFFLINGTYTGFYPVYVSSLPTFPLPQDSAPENYLINQSLDFEMDSAMLPFPQSVIDKTTFNWDFGDGTKAKGLTTKHSYNKIGSYLLTITADYGGYVDPNTKPILQAILLNILPNKNYKLPKAIIKINDKEIKDQNLPTQIREQSVTFDATSSINGSTKIVSYFWDIGDGKSTTQSVFHHTYTDSNKIYVFPILRVKDSNGFISDTFVQLEKSPSQTTYNPLVSPLIIVGLFNILFVGGIIFFLKRR